MGGTQGSSSGLALGALSGLVRAITVGATPRFERSGGGNTSWLRQIGVELGAVGEVDQSSPF